MNLTARHNVPADRPRVWDYHTRPGAVTRLTPPFLHMQADVEATNLRDSKTVFSLPAGLKWEAQHLAESFVEGERFADKCTNAPMRIVADWTHTHTFSDADGGGTEVLDEVVTRAPARLLRPAFAYRQHQLTEDLAFLDRLGDSERLTVAMTGSSGTVGTALRAQLTTAGHRVIRLVRGEVDPERDERHWDVDHPAHNLLDDVDVLVHLAGEPLFGRFNDVHKAEIYSSRVGPTRRLAELVGRVDGVRAFVSASAIGYYGSDRGDEMLGEDADSGEGFLADVVRQWERATDPAREAGKRVVNVRTGVALSGGGGMLPLLAALFSTGLGGTFGDGSMWMSWIALDDLTDIYTHAIVDDTLAGPINAVAPEPVTNKGLAKALGSELNRPAFMPIPSFGPALLLGKEGADELALADQRVDAAVLRERGHTFRYPDIGAALAHELGGEELMGEG